MNLSIIINVIGTLQIDSTTIVTNPTVSVTNANDDYMNSQVNTASLFTSEVENYNLSRQTGSFNYIETWDDDDVKKCVENWIEQHRIK